MIVSLNLINLSQKRAQIYVEFKRKYENTWKLLSDIGSPDLLFYENVKISWLFQVKCWSFCKVSALWRRLAWWLACRGSPWTWRPWPPTSQRPPLRIRQEGCFLCPTQSNVPTVSTNSPSELLNLDSTLYPSSDKIQQILILKWWSKKAWLWDFDGRYSDHVAQNCNINCVPPLTIYNSQTSSFCGWTICNTSPPSCSRALSIKIFWNRFKVCLDTEPQWRHSS